MSSATFNRAALLRRGAAGGAALVGSGTALAFAGSAWAAAPDADLAYLRLLIGAELLAADFQTQALASGALPAAQAALLKQVLADEHAHYAGLAQLLTAAGQIASTPDDFDFSYPSGSFASAGAIAQLAVKIETLSLGAYLGAVESVQTPALRLPIGQIAANEAQHLGALSPWVGKPMIGRAFGPAWPIGAVSDALDAYES